MVFGADNKKIRTQDSIKLIEYAYKNYEIINIQEIVNEKFENWRQLNEKRIYINKGRESYLELEVEKLEHNEMAVKKSDVDNVELEINCIYYFEAPVENGRIVGNAKVLLNGEVVEVLKITSINNIEKKDIFDYFFEFLSLASWPIF